MEPGDFIRMASASINASNDFSMPNMRSNLSAVAKSRALTHVGAIRKVNEDAYLNRPEHGIWAIADGMGGHAAGDVASRTVVDHLAALIPDTRLSVLVEAAETRLLDANRRLLDIAMHNAEHTIGSTVAVLLVRDRYAACLWAGDSRIYRLRGHRLEQLTQDHAVVEDLVASGSLDRGEAAEHPEAHLITRAVGVDPRLNLDIEICDVRANDLFILCSDGLYKELNDRELKAAFATGASGVAGALDLALARGARDNVTVVGVQFA
jgi:protein phosphatase